MLASIFFFLLFTRHVDASTVTSVSLPVKPVQRFQGKMIPNPKNTSGERAASASVKLCLLNMSMLYQREK